MSQQSSTTTTSFIISSNESLNKRPLSSSQSTTSSDIMTASDSMQNNQYCVSLNPLNGYDSMIDQHSGQYSSNTSTANTITTPSMSQSPAQHPHGMVYDSSGSKSDAQATQISYSHSTYVNGNQCNGSSVDAATSIYGTYKSQSKEQSPDNKLTKPQQPSFLGNESSLPFDQELKVNGTQQQGNNSCNIYSPKSKSSVHSFHNNNNNGSIASGNHRISVTSIDSTSSTTLMPLNVKSMLLHGVASHEILRTWLANIKCEEYLKNFVDNGYDMPLLTRMTPQDLTAIGCKSPILRKKILLEIKKLNINDDIPQSRPHSLEQWLELLKLSEYYTKLCEEGYDSIDKVCELTWEDLEEIGINKLGHQKRLLLGIEKVLKFDKQQEECQNDYAIYDVHPNHRISLNRNHSENRLSTLGRSTVRSGFFQTRSGANLDHRGLPVATVMPALKHVNSSLANLDISQQTISPVDATNTQTDNNGNNRLSTANILNNQTQQSIYQANNKEQVLKMSDLSSTIKRNPPPLPPVRTNSLKIPHDSLDPTHCNSVYGNYGISQINGGASYLTTTGSTSFLRTPKLGTLTATTNKMLTHGGHIQSLSGQPQTIRTNLPIREAPPPPLQTHPTLNIPAKIEEEQLPLNSYQAPVNSIGCSNIANQIPHQLASADEFPPPPPSQ